MKTCSKKAPGCLHCRAEASAAFPREWSSTPLRPILRKWKSIPEPASSQVVKLVAAHDVGKAINLLGVENQIEGGAIQGMGFGLMEDQIFDRNTGVCVNPNLVDYKLFTIKDIPEITPDHR